MMLRFISVVVTTKRTLFNKLVAEKNLYEMGSRKFPKGFMTANGYSYDGKLKLKDVSGKAKLISLYHQQNILGPISKK